MLCVPQKKVDHTDLKRHLGFLGDRFKQYHILLIIDISLEQSI